MFIIRPIILKGTNKGLQVTALHTGNYIFSPMVCCKHPSHDNNLLTSPTNNEHASHKFANKHRTSGSSLLLGPPASSLPQPGIITTPCT